MNKNHNLLFGAHMSIAGGLEQAIYRGESIDCTAIQIFTKNNRQWTAKTITDEEANLFKKTLEKSSIDIVVAHATYLINIGSSDHNIRAKSIKALIKELERCDQLNIPYLVLHPGSAGNSDEKECIGNIIDSLNEIFDTTSNTAMILLENTAGQGSSVGYKFEQIATIINAVSNNQRLGVCFDSCHAFAAGYDITSKLGYEDTWKSFDATIGLKHLKAIHVNDSKKGLGNRVDRHEDVGKGAIGLNFFALLFNDRRFFNLPKLLETPKETLEDDAKNMATIKSLILSEAR